MELLGSSYGELFAGGTPPGREWGLGNDEARWELETEIRHTSGKLIPVELHCSFVEYGGGDPQGIQLVAHDVTERRRIAA